MEEAVHRGVKQEDHHVQQRARSAEQRPHTYPRPQ